MTIRKNKAFIIFSFILVLFIVLGNISQVNAEVILMDNVTQEMCSASYWYKAYKEPDKLLTNYDQIKKLNQDIVDTSGTGVIDLTREPEVFDGVEYNDALKSAGKEFGEWCLAQASVINKCK